jgi:alpha-D-xyloside xylohydrolase
MAPPPEPAAWRKTDDGLVVDAPAVRVRLRVLSERAVRVVAWPKGSPEPSRASLAVVASLPTRSLEALEQGGAAILRTPGLTARVTLATGEVAFEDEAGRTLLRETPGGGKTFTPVRTYGEATLLVRQEFEPAEGESLYGLGQHQDRLLDLAGRDLDLWQRNGEIVVPFLLSTRRWGLLWDNPAHTRFGRPEDARPLPSSVAVDGRGEPGRFTATFFADREMTRPLAVPPPAGLAVPPASGPETVAYGGPPTSFAPVSLPPELLSTCLAVRWTGFLSVPATGEHSLFVADALGEARLWIDERLVLDSWSPSRQATDVARLRLEAGRRHAFRLEWKRHDAASTFALKWLPPRASRPPIALWSASAEGIDYVFVRGSTLDGVIAGYRELTGRAALLPRWALGYWQSRERYKAAEELVGTVEEFRARRFPLDVIVQDWQYWRDGAWGSHDFDPSRFPDPETMTRRIHALGARVMISVWPRFYPGTTNFDELEGAGHLYPLNLATQTKDWLGNVFTVYDAFSPEARRVYWRQVERSLFAKGIDAFWLDASEPEVLQNQWPDDLATRMSPTALGPGARVMNAFPLVHARGVHEGQRAAAPGTRVAILTRSAWAGSQRYGAIAWSGDVSARWTALRAQVPAGLSYSLSGMPWWTSDVGGFFVDDPAGSASEAYRELYTRWFQLGAFSPVFRSHGTDTPREPWHFGPPSHPAWRSLVRFAELRYRLLPYLYSLASRVTREHDTMMRALVLDFPEDPRARDVQDQYLLGPAVLVSPVTEPGVTSRRVYLPEGRWYDFWTGAPVDGGRTVDAPAPYDSMPLHIRAGSILPFGPALQWTGERPADPVRLVVYTGRDGSFTLHEDDGETDAHEGGAFSTIPMSWSEARQALTIGARTGAFEGMLTERAFEVAFVNGPTKLPTPARSPARAWGDAPDRVVRYAGRPLTVPRSAP